MHISRGVTSHGFALNVTTDLEYFKLIVPCGISGKPVTSIELETGMRLPMQEVLPLVTRNFGFVFGSQILWLESLDDLLASAADVAAPVRARAAGHARQNTRRAAAVASAGYAFRLIFPRSGPCQKLRVKSAFLGRARQRFAVAETSFAGRTMADESNNPSAGREPKSQAKPRGSGQDEAASSMLRSYNLPDYRLERPEFELHMETVGEEVQYRVDGDLTAPAPPIRESKYLSREQCVELYRWMLLNRRVESALETLYKQSKVIGTVYFGLGQEACSCAAAYALAPEDWMAPAFRNQGALMVRGFTPADIMRQYMAKADSPSFGRDARFAFWRHRAAQCVRTYHDAR